MRDVRYLSNRAGRIAVLLILCCGAGLPGHAGGATKRMDRPVWPAPPEKARIEFVSAYHGKHDFSGGLLKSLSDFAGGEGTSGDMIKPTAIAISRDGRHVYALDAVRAQIYRFEPEARRVRTIVLSGMVHGPKAPFGLAVDETENLYVTDQVGRAVVVLGAGGKFLRAIGGDSLRRPVGCAVDSDQGVLYVVDAPWGAAAIHRVAVFDLSGRFLRWIGARGSAPGEFNFPTYVSVGPGGEVYVVDTLNWRVEIFDRNGRFLSEFGRHSDSRGDFDRPKGIAVDTFGNIYVADSNWDRVLIFGRSHRALLDFGGRGTWPGGLQEPTAVAIDGANRIYVADTNGHRVNVYRLINTTAADSVDESGGRPPSPDSSLTPGERR